MNLAESFVRAMASDWHYPDRYAWLLKHGVCGGDRKRTLRRPLGHCFRNALLLSLDRRDLYYVEGIACPLDHSFPRDHAWCIDKSLNVYDPTWPFAADYFGVPLSKSFVQMLACERETSGPYVDDWMNGWPLVRGDWPASKWKVRGLRRCNANPVAAT